MYLQQHFNLYLFKIKIYNNISIPIFNMILDHNYIFIL